MKLIAFVVLTLVTGAMHEQMVDGSSVESFIVNGNDSTIVPFYAYLEIFPATNWGGNMFFGGGCLISAKHILTVAQNVVGFSTWRIGLGADHIPDMEWFYSNRAVVHPNYNKSSLANNLAIIHLEQNVLNKTNVYPITVLFRDSTFPLPGNILQMVGFGFDYTGVQPRILQKTAVTVQTQTNCEYDYPHLVHNGESINHFCGRNIIRQSNMCPGDQGGPAYDPNTNLLVGIQSFYRIENCTDPESQPPAFIRVSNYKDFIFENILD